MKVLFVGNILPMEVVNLLELSVAGKKYEISLTKAMDIVSEGSLDIVSVSKIGRREAKKNRCNEVFLGKKYIQTITVNLPILSDIIRDIHFFFILLFWCINNIKEKKVIIILNSPFGICMSALLMKLLLGIKPISLTIDTPFTKENTFKGILGLYNKTQFILGHILLNFFAGIIVLNKKVVHILQLKIPYFVSKVGFDESNYKFDEYKINNPTSLHKKKKIIFAGTLVYYNGILTLLESITKLNQDEYELHIYGYGPLEDEVKKYANNYSNIIFHGRIANIQLIEKLVEADLLVNPIITTDETDNFSFPSKIVEYMLSGRPVLTTKFNSLPNEYEEYMFFIQKQTPDGFAEAITNVFEHNEERKRQMCECAISYIKKNQNWNSIATQIYGFISKI